MLLMSDFQKLVRCSRPELLLLAQTFVWLGIMRIAIAVFPFQKIARWLGLNLENFPRLFLKGMLPILRKFNGQLVWYPGELSGIVPAWLNP